MTVKSPSQRAAPKKMSAADRGQYRQAAGAVALKPQSAAATREVAAENMTNTNWCYELARSASNYCASRQYDITVR